MAIASAKPDYALRGAIGKMHVRCPRWNSGGGGGGEGDDGGNEGGPQGCTWKGRLQRLKYHDGECDFAVISCSVEGCPHTCMRKDMENHLSNTDVRITHLELNYERKLKVIEKSFEDKLNDMEKKYDEEMKRQRDSVQRLQLSAQFDAYHNRYVSDLRYLLQDLTRDDCPLNIEVCRIRREDIDGRPICGLLCIFDVRCKWIPAIYRRQNDFHSMILRWSSRKICFYTQTNSMIKWGRMRKTCKRPYSRFKHFS